MPLSKKNLLEFFLGKRTKIEFCSADVKKILILRNDRIGDMIVSTPLLRELKAAYPALRIDVAASSVNQHVIKACPHVGKIIVWDRGGALATLKTVLRIRRERYDLIFSTSNQFSFAFQMRLKLLGARYLVGFNVAKYGTSTARLGMYDRTVDCVRHTHILESYFSALGEFKLANINYKYELFGVEAHAAKARSFLHSLGDRYAGLVCFNYQASAANRSIGKDDVVALCAELADRYRSHAVIVVYPPGGRQQAEAITDSVGRRNVMTAFETANILELAALIRECDIVISPDTSVIHVASAYNKKVLGFYINTDNYRWFYPMCDHFRVMLSADEKIEQIDRQAALNAFEQLMAS